MKKPSIFSSKYQETVKRMRRRNTLIALLVVCVILTIFAIFNDKISKFFVSKGQNSVDVLAPGNQSEDTNNTQALNTKTSNTQTIVNTTKDIKDINENISNKTEQKREDLFYILKLASGRDIKIYYEENNKEKLFTGKTGDNDYIALSPSKKRACIIDKTNQDMYIMNNDNTFVNVTMDIYTAFGRPDEKYYKKDQLASFNNNYLWHDMAKFLTEDKIAYRSRLPYFMLSNLNLYLWVYSLSSNTHQCIFALPPGDVQIKDLDQVGLKITDSGKDYYLKTDNSIVQR